MQGFFSWWGSICIYKEHFSSTVELELKGGSSKILRPWDFPGKNMEWVAISFSRGSSRPRNRTQVSCTVGRFFTNWATREEGWALKNSCFWIVVLEKTLESPLDFKEIKPVNPKRRSILNIHWYTSDPWCEELSHWKTFWCIWALRKVRESGRGYLPLLDGKILVQI